MTLIIKLFLQIICRNTCFDLPLQSHLAKCFILIYCEQQSEKLLGRVSASALQACESAVLIGQKRYNTKAEIAQLVEHNLAKVGVAGPSPVFRSYVLICPGGGMVDAHVSGACVERRAGSSPVPGTAEYYGRMERWRNW